VYYRAQTRRKPYELCVQAMRAAFSQAGGVAREPAVVNLVGLADDRARAELVDLLADLGVAVASTPLPVLTPSPKGARAYLRANASLLVPIRPWQGLYVSLFGGLGVPLVAAPPPYGVEGTRAWASAALAAAGRVQLEPRLDERLSRWREAEWQPRVERAAGHRLGFVCPARELARLVDPARAWGLPLVPVVLEMGFGVDVAIVACGQDEARVAAEAADVLPAPVARTIVSCEAELDAWLTTGGSGAVYSDYFFDDRLLRRGRVPFSRQVFEAGWCGAARTLDRLLRRCTCGFARRFEETA
jgi:hypothetical protein